MSNALSPGDKVRVKPLAAIGQIISISTRLRHTPYLVDCAGYGARAYAASDLEKLPENTVVTLPPPGAPVALVRGPGTSWVCGVRGCWSSIDMSVPTCPKCGTVWK